MVLVIVVILGIGCQAIDHSVDIPAYIRIDSVDLQTDYATEGTDDHKITDVWVLVGIEDLGAYELPATIPVLLDGTQDVRIFGGTKVNGFSTVRLAYPFFESTTLSTKLVPGSTVSLDPQLSYYSDLTFAWIEDFEAGSSIESLSVSDTTLSLETPPPHPAVGDKSAVIRVDAVNDFYAGSTGSKNFVLPLGKPLYIELNYTSNVEFSIGAIKRTLQGDETISPFINLFPSPQWNKIYLDLMPYLDSHVDAVSFEIYFSCLYDPSVLENIVIIDNIKLIHR